jgi:hypothetical protein
MKSPLTTLVAVAALALSVGVSTALADDARPPASPIDGVAYFRANELATAASSARPAPESVTFFRANELATAANSGSVAPESPVATSTGSSDSFVDWTNLSIGLGIGIVLAVGLLLAVRHRPSRPVAQ